MSSTEASSTEDVEFNDYLTTLPSIARERSNPVAQTYASNIGKRKRVEQGLIEFESSQKRVLTEYENLKRQFLDLKDQYDRLTSTEKEAVEKYDKVLVDTFRQWDRTLNENNITLDKIISKLATLKTDNDKVERPIYVPPVPIVETGSSSSSESMQEVTSGKNVRTAAGVQKTK